MFQKLARAVIVCASLLLVASRTLSSVHPSAIRTGVDRSGHNGDSAFVVSQLPARRV